MTRRAVPAARDFQMRFRLCPLHSRTVAKKKAVVQRAMNTRTAVEGDDAGFEGPEGEDCQDGGDGAELIITVVSTTQGKQTECGDDHDDNDSSGHGGDEMHAYHRDLIAVRRVDDGPSLWVDIGVATNGALRRA